MISQLRKDDSNKSAATVETSNPKNEKNEYFFSKLSASIDSYRSVSDTDVSDRV